MGSRSEFHGNIGQVVLGSFHAAPRSQNLYALELQGDNDDSIQRLEGDMRLGGLGGPGGGPSRHVSNRRMLIAVVAAWLFLMALVLAATRPTSTSDIDTFCFSEGGKHSVGAVVRMADLTFRECVRLGETVPEWRHSVSFR